MHTQTMVPAVVPGAPDFGAMPLQELADQCRAMHQDLSWLSSMVPVRFQPTLSTGLTAVAALAAGGIDGYLGDKSNIGPISINTAIAVGMAATAVLANHPDIREAAAAVARGVGAPLLYSAAKQQIEAYRASSAAIAAR